MEDYYEKAGVSLDTYREAVQSGDGFSFVCRQCVEMIPAMDVSDPTPDKSETGFHHTNVSETEDEISVTSASHVHGEFTLAHSLLQSTSESTHQEYTEFGDFTVANSLNVSTAAPAPLNATYIVSRDQDTVMGCPNTESTRLSLEGEITHELFSFRSERNDDQSLSEEEFNATASLYLPRVQAQAPLEERY